MNPVMQAALAPFIRPSATQAAEDADANARQSAANRDLAAYYRDFVSDAGAGERAEYEGAAAVLMDYLPSTIAAFAALLNEAAKELGVAVQGAPEHDEAWLRSCIAELVMDHYRLTRSAAHLLEVK